MTTQYPGQLVRRVQDLVNTHEALGMIKPGANVNKSDFEAAQRAREGIRNFLENLPDKQIGNQHKSAIRNWAQYAKERDIREAADSAERRAGRTGRGLNYQNTIRQEIGKVLTRRRARGGLSAEEEALMRRLESGGKLENLTRILSSFAPWDLHRAFVSMAAGYGFGPAVGFGLAGAGATAHELGRLLSKRDVDELIATIQKSAPANAMQAGRNATNLARAKNARTAATARGAAVGESGGEPYGTPTPLYGPRARITVRPEGAGSLPGDIETFAQKGLSGVMENHGMNMPGTSVMRPVANTLAEGAAWSQPEIGRLRKILTMARSWKEVQQAFPERSMRSLVRTAQRLGIPTMKMQPGGYGPAPSATLGNRAPAGMGPGWSENVLKALENAPER